MICWFVCGGNTSNVCFECAFRVFIDFGWNNATVDPTRCHTREKAGNETANIFVANGVFVIGGQFWSKPWGAIGVQAIGGNRGPSYRGS